MGDRYLIPSVDNSLDAIFNDRYFGKLDLASGYWQVLLNPRDKTKRVFFHVPRPLQIPQITIWFKDCPKHLSENLEHSVL